MCAIKHFCELSPVCYEISWKKEICKRHIKKFFNFKKKVFNLQTPTPPGGFWRGAAWQGENMIYAFLSGGVS